MRFELGLDRPNPRRAPISAVPSPASYLGRLADSASSVHVGIEHRGYAFRISVVTTGVALACSGAIKGQFTGVYKIKSSFQTLLVGGLAAGAAYWLAHLF